MYRKFIVAGLSLCAGLSTAHGTADWKVYAFASAKPPVALFYLDSEIVRTPGHVQVWIKALDEKKLEAIRFHGDKDELLRRTSALVAMYYIPPINAVAKLSTDQLVQLTMFEQVADAGTIVPTLKILYEIDCTQKMTRTLSIIASSGNSDNRVREWLHSPPESPIDTLGKLVCSPAA